MTTKKTIKRVEVTHRARRTSAHFVYDDGRVSYIQTLKKPAFDDMQRWVGGYVEVCKGRDDQGRAVQIVCDEDGKMKYRPVNPLATRYRKNLGYADFVVGPVIILYGWRV